MKFGKNVLFFLMICLTLGGCDNANRTTKNTKSIGKVEMGVYVFDSFGGSSRRDSKLTVFNAGTNQQVFAGMVSKGFLSLSIEGDRSYDFELEGDNGSAKKEKIAGSKVLNYYVGNASKQSLTILQYSLGMVNRGITPPNISVKDKATGKEITDGFEITDDVKVLSVEFSSTVGGVEPVASSGFGAKIAFGSTPNHYNGIKGIFFDPVYENGVFTSKWEFDVDKEKFPKGETKLVVVGYDVANNRVEKHIRVKYEKTPNAISFGDGFYFKGLSMYIDRYPYYMGLFNAEDDGLKIKDSSQSSVADRYYTSGVSFKLKKPGLITDVDVPIIGFDLLRKQGGEWEKVGSKVYDDPYTAYEEPYDPDKAYKGIHHEGFEGNSSLEEGEDYEYKVVAFGETDKIESPVMKAKLLSSFTYSLYEPENFKRVSLDEANNLSFSCKVSEPKFVFNKEVVDYINAGLIIVDSDKNPQFGAKFRYYFDNGHGKPDVRIELYGVQNNIEKKYISEMIKANSLSKYGITNLEDLVEISEGALIIKPKFLKIPEFNILPVVGKRPMGYEYGYVYEWDMQAEWRNPLDLRDDEALHVVKILEFENSGGIKGHVYCRSFGNNKNHGANSINGRFTFSITKK